MRGVAALAVAPDARPELVAEGVSSLCSVCGGPGTGIAPVLPMSEDQWPADFVDYGQLANASRVMCSACYTVAVGGCHVEGQTRDITWKPKGARGFVFADQGTTLLPGGLAGFDALLKLFDRREPFGVLAGYWDHGRNHWLSCPVAFGGTDVYPILWAVSASRSVVWLHRQYLKEVRTLMAATVGDGSRIERTYDGVQRVLAAWPALRPLVCPWAEVRKSGVSLGEAQVAWYVIFGEVKARQNMLTPVSGEKQL